MCTNKTEQEMLDLLDTTCKKYTSAPKIIVAKREVLGGVSRKVTFVCIVNRNLEDLINELVFQGLQEDFTFMGSELNLQDNMDVDYLYITAEISARKGS